MSYAAEVVWIEKSIVTGKKILNSDVSVFETEKECHEYLDGYEGWIERNNYEFRIGKIYKIEKVKE